MELVQSFLLSVTRVRLSLYEQRILTKIVEHGQEVLKGLSTLQYKFVENPYDNEKIEVPIKYILTDGSKDYKKVYDACKALMARKFEFYDPRTKTYYADTVVHNVRHVVGSGKVSFQVSRVLYDVMFNFSLGYKAYDLEKALSLPSPYAVRMYILLNKQEKPLTWDIEQLKEMFGVADKYKQTADFIKKVIEPARQALVHYSCNNFTYSRVFDGRKVTALRLFPVKVKEQDMREYMEMSREQLVNVKALQLMMREDYDFTWKEISTHKKVLQQFAQLPMCVEVLTGIITRARRKRMPKGYVINAIKAETQELKAAIAAVK